MTRTTFKPSARNVAMRKPPRKPPAVARADRLVASPIDADATDIPQEFQLEAIEQSQQRGSWYWLHINESTTADLAAGYVPRWFKCRLREMLRWQDEDRERSRRPLRVKDSAAKSAEVRTTQKRESRRAKSSTRGGLILLRNKMAGNPCGWLALFRGNPLSGLFPVLYGLYPEKRGISGLFSTVVRPVFGLF